MLRRHALAFTVALVASFTALQSPSAFALTVGGWSGLRGGDSGIFVGNDFAAVRKDLAAHFPGTTLAASGTVTDHTSFPTITNGPFGVVNTFEGGFDAYFTNVSPATPLGTWDNSGGVVCLAAMNFGSGKVVFFGTNTFLYGVDMFGLDPGNDTLRRNTLAHLLNVTPRNRYDYNSNGAVDAADFVLWRKTFGQTGANLRADGNLNAEIDPFDYSIALAFRGTHRRAPPAPRVTYARTTDFSILARRG